MDGTLITITPRLPWNLLTPLLLLIMCLLLLGLWRRARGGGGRALAFALLLAVLLEPSLLHEERTMLPDVAVVVVDRSPSQGIGGRRAQTDAALTAVRARLAALSGGPGQSRLDVREVVVGDAEGDPTEPETRLFTALTQALADVPHARQAGAVLITDGQVHDVPARLEGLTRGGPLHVLLTGQPDEADRRLMVMQAPGYGLVGHEVRVLFRVEDIPATGPETPGASTPPEEVTVTVRRDGGPEERLRVPVGVETTYTLPIAHGGATVVELAVEAAPRDLTLANNRALVVINGVRDRLKVLLVSGEPHAGERTWRNLLKADPGVDLVHFTILRPPEKQDGTPIRELSLIAFPIRELFEVKLDEFDLVVFDRYRRRGILPQVYLENIARYVERGGGLLDAGGVAAGVGSGAGIGAGGENGGGLWPPAGDDARSGEIDRARSGEINRDRVRANNGSGISLSRTPVGTVLPAEATGTVLERPFRPRLTALGRRHPVTAGLPGDRLEGEPDWGYWFRIAETRLKAGDDRGDNSRDEDGTTIVMTDDETRPLLLLSRVAKGRVAQLTSDQIWLWNRGFAGGGPQAELLRRLAHWLMKEPELEERDIRGHVDGRRIFITRRALVPDPLPVRLVTPGGAELEIPLHEEAPGLAQAVVPAQEPGLYRIQDGPHTALVVVGNSMVPEQTDMRASPLPLAGAVAASHGSSRWLAAAALPDIRRTRPEAEQAGRDWIGLRVNGTYVVTGLTHWPLLPPLPALALILAALFVAWRREGR